METTILDHFEVTPTVTAFLFTKPVNFTYLPGQFTNIEIFVPDCDERCNKRNFYLLSIPSDDFLMIATRHGVSRFKQTLEQFTKNKPLHMTGPYGRFVLSDDPSIPAVMLSGGIGITPLHAMIKHAAYKKLPKPITLIYANTAAFDIPFKKDLDGYHQSDMNFQVFYTITGEIHPDWKGKTGRINEDMIRNLAPNWEKREFYISGPAQMVLSLKKLVADMGIPAERIKSELFTGY